MFNKIASEIQYSEFEEFCKQNVAESSWLDYKESFAVRTENDKIGKIFSAMANTHGGWVVFGVKEIRDLQGRGHPGPIVGLDMSTDPVVRLKSIGLNAIYPPVVPEFGVCPLPSNPSKAVVLAHIIESDSTPHRTHTDKVYVRTNDVSHLNNDGKEASIEEIDFLLNRRSKSIALKTRLLDRAIDRCAINHSILLSVYCIPKYPARPLVDFKTLLDIAASNQQWEAFRGVEKWRTAHEALCCRFDRATSVPATCEINVYGSLYYSTIVHSRDDISQPPSFDSDTCLNTLWSTFRGAATFYEKCEYGGLVDIGVKLQLQTKHTAVLRVGNQRFGHPVDSNFTVTATSFAHRLIDDDVIESVFRDFLWSAGLGHHSLSTPLSGALRTIENRHQNQRLGLLN